MVASVRARITPICLHQYVHKSIVEGKVLAPPGWLVHPAKWCKNSYSGHVFRIYLILALIPTYQTKPIYCLMLGGSLDKQRAAILQFLHMIVLLHVTLLLHIPSSYMQNPLTCIQEFVGDRWAPKAPSQPLPQPLNACKRILHVR